MPAVNRVVCLLSNPLAAQRGVEGRLVELPIIDTESEATNLQEALREGSEDTGLEVELQMRYATVVHAGIDLVAVMLLYDLN
jgi:hypothetical protein